jgi:hypothetical protein
MHLLAVVLVLVQGLVLRGPTKPVCSMTAPCDEPAAGMTLVFARGDTVVRVRTDDHGRYRVKLRLGTWSIRGARVQPQVLVVRRAMRADLFVDTGIR